MLFLGSVWSLRVIASTTVGVISGLHDVQTAFPGGAGAWKVAHSFRYLCILYFYPIMKVLMITLMGDTRWSFFILNDMGYDSYVTENVTSFQDDFKQILNHFLFLPGNLLLEQVLEYTVCSKFLIFDWHVDDMAHPLGRINTKSQGRECWPWGGYW